MRAGLHIMSIAAALLAATAQAADTPISPESRPAASATDPIPWRQNLFSIPFRVGQAREEATQPVEVQLFVSEDQGAKWRLESRVKPEQGSFTFQAPHDGEFWFAIRTVDKQNRLRPEGDPTPELRVIVDTEAPRVDLNAFRAPSGEVVARWQISDPNLDPNSLRLDYRTDLQQPWRPVAFDPTRSDFGRGASTGEVTFLPPERTGQIVVRASINDRAGNPAVAQANVETGSRTPPDRASAKVASTNLANDRDSRDPWVAMNNAPRQDNRGGWPPEQATTLPANKDALKRNNTPPSMAVTFPNDNSGGRANQGGFVQDTSGRGSNTGDRFPPSDSFGYSVKRSTTATPSSYPSLGRAAGDENAGAEYLPRGQEPRRVNSTSFEMEYDLDSVGPSGIARVEMWGTRDGGKTWTSCGVDPDNRSPMRVTVDGEGIYGFRMVILAGNGIGGRPPASGDQPEVWVAVDLTPPTARLNSAELGTGPHAGELLITWEANDTRLAARPVSLSFSSQPGGPWTTIAAGLENTGAYGWRLDSRVPDRVYIRLEVRDEAGNIGIVESAEPIALDQVRPSARIRSVRPVGDTTRQSRLSQLWR